MYLIEKNIPVGKFLYDKYPLKEMDIGDSFFIDTNNDDKIRSLRTYANKYGKQNDKKFIVRKYENGFRCWRIK